MKNVAVCVIMVGVATLPAFGWAEPAQVEKDLILLAQKRSIAIAASRLPIEQTYLNELKREVPKAEATKDLDLQLKLRDEIAIVEKNIEYFQIKKEEKMDITSDKKIFGVTWRCKEGYFFKINDRNNRFWNNWSGDKGKPIRIDGNRFYYDEKGYYEYLPELDAIQDSKDRNTYYRDGRIPKNEQRAISKAPVGEEVNTLFGKRAR